MKCWFRRFNSYLLLAVVLAIGCETTNSQTKKDKKSKKENSTLRFHLEMFPDGGDRTMKVQIPRDNPLEFTVEKQPFLDEGEIEQAALLDHMGSYLIKLQFSRRGAWVLENLTASNVGKRVALQSQFTEGRWLAAPMITRRISDGSFLFTPDATREEAERIVRGLNNVATRLKKPFVF
jgi:preprotein translocase subunit SecD